MIVDSELFGLVVVTVFAVVCKVEESIVESINEINEDTLVYTPK